MAEQDAIRITTAGTSRSADISARQKRYAISMLIRTVCFVAAVAVGPGWLRWVLIAGAVLLPYVAVVMANAEDSRTTSLPLTGGGDPQRQLGPGDQPEHTDQDAEDREHEDRGHGA